MAWTDLTSVPAELEQLFAKYVAPQSAAAPPSGPRTVRTKPTVTRAPRVTKRTEAYWLIAARYISQRLYPYSPESVRRSFERDEIARIREGIFSPDYWRPLVRGPVQGYTSTPASSPAWPQPPYAYRDPLKLCTDTTYTTSTTTTLGPAFQGQIIEGYWHDVIWRYRRELWGLVSRNPPATQPPIIWLAEGDIEAHASHRGARPMFSAIAKAYFCKQQQPATLPTAPPATRYNSLYWRFRIPRTDPPFFAAAALRPFRILLNPRAIAQGLTDPNTIAVLHGPRPAFGRGFNNNDTIDTAWSPETSAYQVIPCLGKPPGPQWTEFASSQRVDPNGNQNLPFTITGNARDHYPTVRAAVSARLSSFPVFHWWSIPSTPVYWMTLPVGYSPAPSATDWGPVARDDFDLYNSGTVTCHATYSRINPLGQFIEGSQAQCSYAYCQFTAPICP